MPPFACLLSAALFILVCSARVECRKCSTFLPLLAAPLAYLVGVLGSRRIVLEGYYWTRWLDPACLVLMIPICIGCAIIVSLVLLPRERWSIWLHSQPRCLQLRVVLGIAVGVMLFASVPFYSGSFMDRRHHIASDARAIHIVKVQPGKWINDHTPTSAVVGVNDAGAIRYFGRRHTVDLLGLNNSAIAFGKISQLEALQSSDWLAIVPALFNNTVLREGFADTFKPRAEARITLAEYTVCWCPGQTVTTIFEKVSTVAAPP